jgi:crotonobetainyl-CoA:carnitine CoA-transferase CaiB-like acyl-CoA transferase
VPGPLHGLRVLDLSRVLAGPWCVQNLGDLGADVIKVERPVAGDDSRHWGPPWLKDAQGEPTRESAYYLSANRNKRSVAIDIAVSEGQQLVRRLAERSDVLIENYKVGGMQKFGLDYASMRAVNPHIVYCSITGFGQDGPYAERPGYDYLFQGLGGLMSVTGERDDRPGGGPQKVGIPIVDLFTGMYATVSILAALHHRDSTGAGQHIDVSLFDTVLAMSSGALSNYFISGKVPGRIGTSSANITPYDVFPCADGQMVVASANQSQFTSLARAIGKPELAVDPRFTDNGARMTNHAELFALLSEVFRSKPRMEWEEILSRAGVPCGPINDYRQALAHPQAAHHGTKIELEHPYGVRVPGVANPMRFSETPVEYRRAPPLLGQHTREVLGELLGLGESELDRLEAEKVIGSRGG